MCRTPREADEMAAACGRHQVKLALAHLTRYSPRLQAVRQLIADGRIGDVLELRARGKEDSRGGAEDLWVLGSHLMNLIHQFGGEPDWCFAEVRQGGRRVTKADVRPGNEGLGPLAGDSVFATFGMNERVTASFASVRGTGTGRPWRFALQILGSKGIIEIQTGFLPEVFYLPDPAWSPGRTNAKWLPVSSAGIDVPEPLENQDERTAGNVVACRDLLAAIAQDREPECDVHEGRWTVEMISAVFESHRLNTPVTFPLRTRDNPLDLLEA